MIIGNRANARYWFLLIAAMVFLLALVLATSAASASSRTNTYNGPSTTSLLIGHVTWQGRPAQPDVRQQFPISLTLKLGATEVNYPVQTTDASGFFTVSVDGLANGTYDWLAKGHYQPASQGPAYLSISGTVTLTGDPMLNLEMGMMLAADANDDNVVAIPDFNIMKAAVGCRIDCWDPRADFNGDGAVTVVDFNLLKTNFGQAGAPAVRPMP